MTDTFIRLAKHYADDLGSRHDMTTHTDTSVKNLIYVTATINEGRNSATTMLRFVEDRILIGANIPVSHNIGVTEIFYADPNFEDKMFEEIIRIARQLVSIR